MRKILFITFLVLLSACEKKEVVAKPENLIAEPMMEQIIFDLTYIKAIEGQDRKLADIVKGKENNYIYTKYNIDSLQLAQSNIYYASYPEKYGAMYERIENRFERMKDSVNASMRANTKTRDSLIKQRQTEKSDTIKPAITVQKTE